MDSKLLVTLGRWAFLFGVILSVLGGMGGVIPGAVAALFILGVVTAVLSIPEKDSNSFLVAVIALLVIGVAGLQVGGWTRIVGGILSNLIAFLSSAGLIVALKQGLSTLYKK